MKTGWRWGLSIVMVMMLCWTAPVWAAFPSDEFQVLEVKDIMVLSDERLIEGYIDVLAEMEASKAFHTTSGFTPKEYRKYKDVIKYRLQLLFEIHRRKMELPMGLE